MGDLIAYLLILLISVDDMDPVKAIEDSEGFKEEVKERIDRILPLKM